MRGALLVSSVPSLEGGAERSLLELARHLPDEGWRPALAAWSGGSLAEGFREAGLDARTLREAGGDPASPLGGRTVAVEVLDPLIRSLNAARLALRPVGGEARFLSEAAREAGADLLHTNCDLSIPAAARAAARTGLPWVAHVRDRTRSWLHPRIFGALRTADAVVTPGRGLARWLAEEAGLAARAIPDPISLEPLLRTPSGSDRRELRAGLGVPDGVFAAVAVGRLEEAKGTWDLVAAAEALEATGEAFVLVLAGRGKPAFEEALDERIGDAGLEGRILRVGWRADVAEWLPALDAVVAPGRREALPRAIVEGMAAGLPVVAAADGGGAEVIADGESGLLVPPADPEAIVDALRRLMAEPALGRELGRAARERARSTFEAGAATRAMATVYEELLATSARGAGSASASPEEHP